MILLLTTRTATTNVTVSVALTDRRLIDAGSGLGAIDLTLPEKKGREGSVIHVRRCDMTVWCALQGVGRQMEWGGYIHVYPHQNIG